MPNNTFRNIVNNRIYNDNYSTATANTVFLEPTFGTSTTIGTSTSRIFNTTSGLDTFIGNKPRYSFEDVKGVTYPIEPKFGTSFFDREGSSFRSIMLSVLSHQQEISRMIAMTICDYMQGKEWTKDERYKIWFDKWVEVTRGILWREDNVVNPSTRTLGYWPILFPHLIQYDFWSTPIFKEQFKTVGRYDAYEFNGKTRRYAMNAGNFGKPGALQSPIYMESFFSFFPELISTYANTFIYRLIEIKDNNDKVRKITIVNQKLPKEYKDRYKLICTKPDLFLMMWEKITNNFITSTKGEFIQDSVKGFRRNYSYLDHVNSHHGAESVMTCDINKFYNSLNLKNVIDNNIFASLFDRLIIKEYSGYINNSKEQIEMLKNLEIFSSVGKNYLNFVKNYFVHMCNITLYFHTFNGLIPTGTHSAPSITNLLMIPFDLDMEELMRTKYTDVKYTRYVDDICLSSKKEKDNNGNYVISIDAAKDIEKILNKYGLYLKYTKTKIFGKNDTKVIANLNLTNVKNQPSIGSKYKLEIKQQLDGKNYEELTDSERGILSWVRSVNITQYKFILQGIKNVPKKLLPAADAVGIFDNMNGKDLEEYIALKYATKAHSKIEYEPVYHSRSLNDSFGNQNQTITELVNTTIQPYQILTINQLGPEFDTLLRDMENINPTRSVSTQTQFTSVLQSLGT